MVCILVLVWKCTIIEKKKVIKEALTVHNMLGDFCRIGKTWWCGIDLRVKSGCKIDLETVKLSLGFSSGSGQRNWL